MGATAKSAYDCAKGFRPEKGSASLRSRDGVLRGSVRFWPICDRSRKGAASGPPCGRDRTTGRGIGIALMKRGVEDARSLGPCAIILVGDAPYYARAGFAPDPTGQNQIFPAPSIRRASLDWRWSKEHSIRLAATCRRPRIDDPVLRRRRAARVKAASVWLPSFDKLRMRVITSP